MPTTDPPSKAQGAIDPKTPFLQKSIAVLGFGSQGFGQACNLKDSGANVSIALRSGSPTIEKAQAAGFNVTTIEDAAKTADVLVILLPDVQHGPVFKSQIAPHLRRGQTLVFSHGFSVLYGEVSPPEGIDVILVAPKGPGHLVRGEYQRGRGVPALIAIHQDATGTAKQTAMAYAEAIGAKRGGVIETTFKNETETDLFGEQAVLCGGATALVKAGFETLVEAGYPAELAYFECLHELKLIVDLMYEGGIDDMRYSISDTARYGDVSRGPRVIDASVKARMKEVLTEIQNGTFAREWIAEVQAGTPNLKAKVAADAGHEIERVGKTLRDGMAWLGEAKFVDRKVN
ncbi:MAG: ketol-acid reductoisomerase [Vampirovibrionales bacterium]|nr:ketol-acid reductoisomerase [Vampirovibrionales bacterium]